MHSPEDASVALRMFWATYRQKSKPEDHAYLLLGLFDVQIEVVWRGSSQVLQASQALAWAAATRIAASI